MALLEWHNLAKTFGRRCLFSGVSGALEPGQILVVTGPNGSGKTTFLKILSGLVRADQGNVERAGGPTSLGYAAPDLALYGELTGRENLEFFADVRGVNQDPIARLLERAGIARAGTKPVSAYSSGMRQRLKLCFALLARPDVLLLDEPTLALDSDGVAFVEQILAESRDALGGAVIATNDPAEAARWGRDGRFALDSQR